MEADHIKQLLISIVEENADTESVQLSDSFEALGMDSLDYILLLQDVRAKIGPVTDGQAQRAETVGDLLKILESVTV